MSYVGPKARNWSEGKGPFWHAELLLHVNAHAKEQAQGYLAYYGTQSLVFITANPLFQQYIS